MTTEQREALEVYIEALIDEKIEEAFGRDPWYISPSSDKAREELKKFIKD